jgi:hypothetical protein
MHTYSLCLHAPLGPRVNRVSFGSSVYTCTREISRSSRLWTNYRNRVQSTAKNIVGTRSNYLL